MRVLLVDDDPRKTRAITEFLCARGVEAGDIVAVEHAAAARMQLERQAFDVLLIDVLLPARANSQPSGEHSVELLRQIVEDGTSTAPRYLIGITGDIDGALSYVKDFESLVTQVIHYNPGDGLWQETLAGLVQFFNRQREARDTNDFDVCVLNALRSPELEAVLKLWPMELGAEKILCQNIVHRTGTMDVAGKTRRVVCAHLSQMGPVASTHAAATLLQEFRPRLLVMTGICGGFADQVSVGDLVIAEKSWDWQAGKWADGGALAPSGDPRDATAELVAIARTVTAVVTQAHDQFSGAKPEAPPKLVPGPMVTGSSVVASLDIQKVFRGQHRKMAGIDMECYGMYYAVANHAGAPVRTLCIKAVSDLADRAKADDHQMYCSHVSAAAMLGVIDHYFQAGR